MLYAHFANLRRNMKYICKAEYFEDYSTAFLSVSTIREIKSKTGR
jgi:hypothetical protein